MGTLTQALAGATGQKGATGSKEVGPVGPAASIVDNPAAGAAAVWAPCTRSPQELHRKLPHYAPSRLLRAPALAARAGVNRVLLKEETGRFGLPSFKLLGASWACYRALSEHIGAEPGPWADIEELAEELKALRPFRFAAATDGNHGRAVAHMARLLGFSSRIFVPEGTAAARIDALVSEGAEVEVVNGSYDDAVARSAEEAGPSCLVISDTSWPGYEQVPRWVIEGYSTMFWEVEDRLGELGTPLGKDDVVVVPIGVGALAAAAVNHFRRGPDGPAVVGVEPLDANCVMASVQAGKMVVVPGPHRSIMAGLNCATPSRVAWPLLSSGLESVVAVSDDQARHAVRELAALGLAVGETGAAALAGLDAMCEQKRGPGPGATVLLLCTEGVTDPVGWRSILGIEVL
ncbi:MAG TPA: diaminopropionate ammonia-lyase [Acidimicrobiales bacterium]|nr:diaminopropionate ammonia-lyase [Acidimicrobiales bacterium]